MAEYCCPDCQKIMKSLDECALGDKQMGKYMVSWVFYAVPVNVHNLVLLLLQLEIIHCNTYEFLCVSVLIRH
jgi:hypothetical protein